MTDKVWKADERWWSNDDVLGGQRNPSQGIPYPDLESEHYVAEHKSHQFHTLSLFLRRAIGQFHINKGFANGRVNLLLFSFSLGRGKPKQRFALVEIGGDGVEADAFRRFIESQCTSDGGTTRHV